MYCRNCGNKLNDDAKFCNNCGAPIDVDLTNYRIENQQVNNTYVNDSGSFWWGVLGCFFPVVGLILFAVYFNKKPKTAKALLIGSLIGVAINFLFACNVIIDGVNNPPINEPSIPNIPSDGNF